MNAPLQQYTYLGQTVILRPGSRFTKKELISRLHEMDVQFDQTVQSKNYYIDLYENALKYDVNRKKIFSKLVKDTIYYNNITNSKIVNNQNIIETPPKDNVKKISIINNRVINENDLSNRQKININNNNEYEFLSNNNNQQNNYSYKQTSNIQYNNNNNNNMIKTNRFYENNNQNNNQYTFRDAIANEIKKTEINLQNQNNFQNSNQNKNQNNDNSYYNNEQNKTFMNQSNQNYEQRRNINYNQSNNYMNNQSNNTSSDYNKINQSNYGTSEMPKNYNVRPNQLSYNQQNYEPNKQNNIQQNYVSQSQQQNFMQNQNQQNNNRMNQNNNYKSQNQINQNYPTFNDNYSNQNSQNNFMNNESKYSSKGYTNQSQQNFNNNMKTNISNSNNNINQYERKNCLRSEGEESNQYYNQTQKYNNENNINPISLSIQNAVNDNNQNSQMIPNPNNSENYQIRNNRRPILTNNMSVIDESDGEDSQSNFSIVSNIDRIKNYFNNKENRDYCYNILLVIICAFLLFIIFSYGLRFSRTIYGKGTEVIETITNPRRLFIDLLWGLIKGIIVGILWDYVYYTIPFVVLSFVIYIFKQKYDFEQTCKNIIEDIKKDLRNKPRDNNGRRTISENEIISRYSQKYNIDHTKFVNKYLKKLSSLRSKDGSLKEFQNINNQGVIIKYWELIE